MGFYGLNFIVMHIGKEISAIESSVMMHETGVDGQESITVKYEDGRMAVTTHSIYGISDRKGIYYGE
ncbi:gfo/Idh/MocA family oxidoreductase, partial [Coprococcus eutactus]|nr:gfo/Idh/MocA family oxidoreductase [Coprococcus eutactus]